MKKTSKVAESPLGAGILRLQAAAVETAANAIVITDRDGHICWANPAFTHLSGYTLAEVLGQNLRFLRSAEHDKAFYRNLWNTVLSGKVWRGKMVNRRKSGTLYTEEMTITPMSGDGGQITHFIAIKQDVTQREELKDELLQTNQKLLVVHQVHEALFAAQSTSEVVTTLVNVLVRDFMAYFARVWLIRPGDRCSQCALAESCAGKDRCLHLMASAGHYSHIDGDHRRVPLGAFKIGLIAQGRGKTISNDVVNDDRVHNREWAQKHGLRSFAGLPLVCQGEVIGVMAMFSQEKLPEYLLNTLELLAQIGASALMNVANLKSLLESEEKFRSISASAQDAIIMLNSDDKISFWNNASEMIFGYAREEVMGKDLHALIVPDQARKAHYQALPVFQKTGQGAAVGKTLELAALRKNGEEFPMELSLSSVKIKGKWHAVGMVRDLTDRKRAEQADRDRKGLQDAVKAMERVLGFVCHELRTPLAALRATSEYLLTDNSSDAVERDMFLGSINTEVMRMSEVVNNMLEAARMNSGQVKWDWDEVHLEAVCDAALNVIRPLIDHTKVALRYEVSPSQLTMRGDSDALQRLIINFASNSAKHTVEGFIDIKINQRYQADKRLVEFQVADSGEGIPERVVKKLGQAFVLNSGFVGSDYIKGTGLGLAICKGIVAAHEGTISIESIEGGGTTFTVLLPADLNGPAEDIEEIEIMRKGGL